MRNMQLQYSNLSLCECCGISRLLKSHGGNWLNTFLALLIHLSKVHIDNKSIFGFKFFFYCYRH